jgi:hypothetical protein
VLQGFALAVVSKWCRVAAIFCRSRWRSRCVAVDAHWCARPGSRPEGGAVPAAAGAVTCGHAGTGQDRRDRRLQGVEGAAGQMDRAL